MGAMFDVPHNLERWPNRKAPFHTRKLGKNVLLSSECSVAERETPLSSRDDGVVYTAEPVAVGDVWRITVLSRASKWMNGLRVGLTTELPSAAPRSLPEALAGPTEWVYAKNTLYHDWKWTDISDVASLADLRPFQTVGLMVTPVGELHLFLDDKHCCKIAAELPVDKPLWGVADLYERCTKIQSSFMSDPREGVGSMADIRAKEPKFQYLAERLNAIDLSGPGSGHKEEDKGDL